MRIETGGDGQRVVTYSLFAEHAPTMAGATTPCEQRVLDAGSVDALESYLDVIALVIDERGWQRMTLLGAARRSLSACGDGISTGGLNI